MATLVNNSVHGVTHTNPSSSVAIAARTIVDLGRHLGYGVTQAEIPASGSGLAARGGRLRVAKAAGAGTAIAKGQRLGVDLVNQRVIKGGGRGFGTAVDAAGDDATEVIVDLFVGGIDSARVVVDRVVTSAEATANEIEVAASETGASASLVGLTADIIAAAGTLNTTGKAITDNGDGSYTIAADAVAATDRVVLTGINPGAV